MMATVYFGAPLWSDFRLQGLLSRIKSLVPATSLTAHTLYLCDGVDQLTDAQKVRLGALLETQAEPAVGTVRLWILPRLGTVSPWASKALDIMHHCGVTVSALEQGRCVDIQLAQVPPKPRLAELAALLHDPLTEEYFFSLDKVQWPSNPPPKPLNMIPLAQDGFAALSAANQQYNFALSDDEIRYLVSAYEKLGRDPTDAELMMFAQANSEHCRHKIFRGAWTINGKSRERSLFDWIKQTYATNPEGVLSA
ncbi:MAG: phosphoribosylformylglycinamidine synthase, partial [Pseudomonadota bacterium]